MNIDVLRTKLIYIYVAYQGLAKAHSKLALVEWETMFGRVGNLFRSSSLAFLTVLCVQYVVGIPEQSS